MKTIRRRPLTIPEILTWADRYRADTGKWPTQHSGSILGALFETWLGVDAALRHGLRTLPGGSSLAQLLAKKRAGSEVFYISRIAWRSLAVRVFPWPPSPHFIFYFTIKFATLGSPRKKTACFSWRRAHFHASVRLSP